MSDQQAGHANLHFLIERAHSRCLEQKIFQGYFDTCSEQPYYAFLQEYKTTLESKGEKPTFSDFLEHCAGQFYQKSLEIVTGENNEKSEEEKLSQEDLEEMAKTRVKAWIEKWKEKYQYYEHAKIIKYQQYDQDVRDKKENSNPLLPFEDFAQSCKGQLFDGLFGPYVASLEGKDDIPTLRGLLKFCYDKEILVLNGKKSLFADCSQKYAAIPTDVILSINNFTIDGHTDAKVVREIADTTVGFLSEGLYVYRLAENGTLQNSKVAELFREIFHSACTRKSLLKKIEQEVGLKNFKLERLENPTSLLKDLGECRASAAAIIYKYLGDVSLIQSYAGSEAVKTVQGEVETKCDRGTEEICRDVIELCERRKDFNRTANDSVLHGDTLSEEVLKKLERLTSTTPATPQESHSSSGGGFSEAVLLARFGEREY